MSTGAAEARWPEATGETAGNERVVGGGIVTASGNKSKMKRARNNNQDAPRSVESGGNHHDDDAAAARQHRHFNVVEGRERPKQRATGSPSIKPDLLSVRSVGVEVARGDSAHAPLSNGDYGDLDVGVVIHREKLSTSSSLAPALEATFTSSTNIKETRKKKRRSRGKRGAGKGGDQSATDDVIVGTQTVDRPSVTTTAAAAAVGAPKAERGVNGGDSGSSSAGVVDGSSKVAAKAIAKNKKKGKRKRKTKEDQREEGGEGTAKGGDGHFGGIPFALPPSPGAPVAESAPPTSNSGPNSSMGSTRGSPNSKEAFAGEEACAGELPNGGGPHVAAASGKANEGVLSPAGVGHGVGAPRTGSEAGSGRRYLRGTAAGVVTAAAAKSGQETAERVGLNRLPRKHQDQRRKLPIFGYRDEIIRTVKGHQTVVLVGETGSGKSTQVPQFLFEAGITGRGGGWHRGEASSNGALSVSPGAAQGANKPGGKGGRLGETRHQNGQGFPKGGIIGCTQPRRVAAVTVARRVAAEIGSELGHVVGYSVRFDDRTSKSTRIKYMTDGVLLREAMGDPLLSAYSAIVLDEAHERSLDTDVLFGLIRRAQPERPDLKVVVMSATLDVDLFRLFFRDAVSLQVPGRTHPVEVMYADDDQDDYLDACLVTCLQIQEEDEGDGDVLVFLPGQEDIEALAHLLAENLTALRAERSRELAAEAAGALQAPGENELRSSATAAAAKERVGGSGDGFLRPTLVCPVFAALPQEQQLDAFKPVPPGTRKFVLDYLFGLSAAPTVPTGAAVSSRSPSRHYYPTVGRDIHHAWRLVEATNIAETSVTINGIRYVVDSGKVKVRSFQPSTGMEFLRSQDVSKAQATQRAGRAGREAAGVCYRLFREESYLALADASTPEILRVNLAQVVLQLKVMGIEDPSTFDYVTAPSPSALLAALKKLVMLGALDNLGGVTADGKKMAALPLDPAFAHLVVRSAEPRFSCAKEVLTTVACLSAENLFFYPSKEDAKRAASEAHRAFAAYEGDLPTLLNIYRGFCKERKDPEWCRRNFVNGRAVARAVDVRQQLAKILRERLRIDPEESCGAEMSRYLRCLVAGLFTNVATRQPAAATAGGGRACYRTVVGNREAHIHPSSTLCRRNPPAKSVVFTELLSTTRDFIKTVTAVDASWLRELVPRFFKSANGGPPSRISSPKP